jgi:hypothetical protein
MGRGNVMPCSWVEVYRLFEGTYCLHLQGRRYSKQQERQRQQDDCFIIALCLLLNILSSLRMEAVRPFETSHSTGFRGVVSRKPPLREPKKKTRGVYEFAGFLVENLCSIDNYCRRMRQLLHLGQNCEGFLCCILITTSGTRIALSV